MKPRAFDPLHLDVEIFAQEGGDLAGEWPLPALDRLGDAAHSAARPRPADKVRWAARAERRAARGAPPQTWLHVGAAAELALVCQRCLGPVSTRLDVQRSFMFAPDEMLAADAEDDVLAMTRSLDLRALVEDELLLALPLVPRHDVCPEPLPLRARDEAEPAQSEPPHPFAALAALKRSGRPN